jgi:hypothetical protein
MAPSTSGVLAEGLDRNDPDIAAQHCAYKRENQSRFRQPGERRLSLIEFTPPQGFARMEDSSTLQTLVLEAVPGLGDHVELAIAAIDPESERI